MTSRRQFIRNTAIAGAGMSILPHMAMAIERPSQEGELRVGLIGVGLRGTNHLRNLLLRDDVRVTAICDVDPDRIALCKNLIAESGKGVPKSYAKGPYDYRNLLNSEEVDAVIISTP